MFGNILNISKYYVVVENTSKKIEPNMLGIHVIFESPNKQIVGEITEMSLEKVKIIFIGEFKNNKFINGMVDKPPINSKIRLIYREEVHLLLGEQEVDKECCLYLGKSLKYKDFNVSANMNNFFSGHFAIIGNTGSGKSSSVARIMQNLFYRQKELPINANIVLFDVYGEYNSAFQEINKTHYFRSKNLTTQLKFAQNEIISIPPYFLDVDDLALLLNAEDYNQLPIIEKALKLVYLFTEKDEDVIVHKNSILSKALLDILSSGRNSTQIRDQIIAVLSVFNTKDINLNSQIVQPGYIRTLKQCLTIDATGKINTMQLVVEFLEKYAVHVDLPKKEHLFYTLNDLYKAFEFALISEGILKSDKVYDKSNILKVRLDTIINSDQSKYFLVDKYITKEEYVKRLFITKSGEKAQILNINLNYIDERFAKVLTKIYSKLFFDYVVSLNNRTSFPIQILLEEAHRYVQNGNDGDIIGYNIFDRITKEGRKYGLTLGLITQRPSELSSTVLSQCSNYLVFRLYHPQDSRVITDISYSINKEEIEELKVSRPGVALVFGTAFNIPQFVQIDMPNPPPNSASSNIEKIWFKKQD